MNDVLASYTDDPLLTAFAREFCDDLCTPTNVAPRAQIRGGRTPGGLWGGTAYPMDRCCARILYECVAYDKPAALILYLQLHHAALTIHWRTCTTVAWTLHVALEPRFKILLGQAVSANQTCDHHSKLNAGIQTVNFKS